MTFQKSTFPRKVYLKMLSSICTQSEYVFGLFGLIIFTILIYQEGGVRLFVFGGQSLKNVCYDWIDFLHRAGQ